ncbi:hypothetical protein K3G63_04800 [Hymenobacter sp. HSC-4F20]|uniref:hypothetical protein n=1 Tax=Hymenobacter sp. HSC-4F20 TaxID=2864135 RepID=UPI001C72F42B|nr:hypothetical protein [Hymenobacter sp. HSC-4F20]MBX0289743.1 hypothetical protein [Hymenobacter sp. HSC-4F20]
MITESALQSALDYFDNKDGVATKDAFRQNAEMLSIIIHAARNLLELGQDNSVIVTDYIPNRDMIEAGRTVLHDEDYDNEGTKLVALFATMARQCYLDDRLPIPDDDDQNMFMRKPKGPQPGPLLN